MADVFDQIHAQQPAAAGGDVFDQIHSSSSDQPLPAFKQPDGSALGRFGGALWDSAKSFGKVLGDLTEAGTGIPLTHAIQPNVAPQAALVKDIEGIVKSHYDQAQKAKDAFDKGNYMEAFGHSLATIAPMIGPAAAHAAERMTTTTQPTFDRYGNVVKSGQAPDVAGGAGEATALLVPSAVAPTIRAIRGRMQGPPEIPPAASAPESGGLIKSTLNPVEQAAVDYLKSKGVHLDVGTQTGNKFVKAIQKTVEHQPLGSQAAEESALATQSGLTRVAGELSNDIHPDPVTPESAGTAVKVALGKRIDNIGQVEDAAYEKAWQGRNDPMHTYNMPVKGPEPVLDARGNRTGEMTAPVTQPVNMPVDVRDIKAALKPIFDEMQWMPAAEQSASAGFQAVKKILGGDDFIPAWQAERGLGGLKTMARVTSQSGVRDAGQGIAASIIPTLQDGIDAAVAHTGPDAIRGLQAGRAAHASLMEVRDLADKMLAEPVQAFDQLTWKHDTGIKFLERIADEVPDAIPQIARAYVDNFFDLATREGGFAKARTILSKWQNLGPRTKALFFPNPALRAGLDNFFKGAEMVGQNPNPSGTALVQAAQHAGSINPTHWMAGWAGSKLLFTPRGAALLRQSLQPGSPAAAAAIAAKIRDLAKETGAASFTTAAGQIQQQ